MFEMDKSEFETDESDELIRMIPFEIDQLSNIITINNMSMQLKVCFMGMDKLKENT